MELMFSRFDLDRLVTGDWELICGRWEQVDKAGRLLKIEDDGLYVNAQDRWEHPGDDGLVLPIPFTLAQFKEFCERHQTFEWEAVESQFTNDDGSLDEDALKELGSRSEAAAALVRGVLVGPGDDTIKALEARRKIDECRAEIADLKSLKPTTITERVLARQELDELEARLASLLDSDDATAEHQTAQRDAPGCNKSECGGVAAPMTAASASISPAWTVTRPKRYKGYAVPLHRLLAVAQLEGRPRPTARDVVEAWRSDKPAEVVRVLSDGFDYYDAQGNEKPTNLEAIRKSIDRMTTAR